MLKLFYGMWGHKVLYVFYKGMRLSQIIFTAVYIKTEKGESERVFWLDLQGTLRGERQYPEFPNSEPTMKQPI